MQIQEKDLLRSQKLNPKIPQNEQAFCLVMNLSSTLINTSGFILDAINSTLNLLTIQRISLQDIPCSWGLSIQPEEFNINLSQIMKKYNEDAIIDEHLLKKCYAFFREKVNTTSISPYLMPGVYELIAYAKQQNIKLAIFTNNSKDQSTQILGQLGLYQKFDIIIGQDNCFAAKPCPHGLEIISKQLQIHPSNMIFIGHDTKDAEAALHFGIQFIGVTSSKEFASEKWGGQKCEVAQSLNEAAALLSGKIEKMRLIVEYKKRFSQPKIEVIQTEMMHQLTKDNLYESEEEMADSFMNVVEVDVTSLEALRECMCQFSSLFQRIQSSYQDKHSKIIFIGCEASGRIFLILERIFQGRFGTKVIFLQTGGYCAFISSAGAIECQITYAQQLLTENHVDRQNDLLVCFSSSGTARLLLTCLHLLKESRHQPILLTSVSSDSLIKFVDQFEQYINIENVLSFVTGPMALTGSTRMQSASIMSFLVGYILENIDQQSHLLKFQQEIDELIQSLKVAFPLENVKQYIKHILLKEIQLYQQQKLIQYVINDPLLLMEALMDNTQKNATFNLPTLSNQLDQRIAHQKMHFQYFLQNSYSSENVWRQILKQSFAEVIERQPKLLGYNFSFSKNECLDESSVINYMLQIEPGTDPRHFLFQIISNEDTIQIKLPLKVHHRYLICKILFNTATTVFFGHLKYITGNIMSNLNPTNTKLIYRAVYMNWLKHPHLSWRLLERHVCSALLGLQFQQSLMQKVAESISKQQEQNVFQTLGNKKLKLMRINQENVIQIKTNRETYGKLLRCYELLTKHSIRVPTFIKKENQIFTIYQHYISNHQEEVISQQYIDKKIGIALQIHQIPASELQEIYSNQQFENKLWSGFEYFQRFILPNRISWKQEQFLKQRIDNFYILISEMPVCPIHRDLNSTNILLQKNTHEIYLIDIENICIGPYVYDISYLIADRITWQSSANIDYILDTYFTAISSKFPQISKQKFHQDVALFTFTNIFRVMFQFIEYYYRSIKSFQLEMPASLPNLIRFLSKLKSLLPIDKFQMMELLSDKIIRYFLKGYQQISALERLPDFNKKIILIYGAPSIGKTTLSKEVKQILKKEQNLDVKIVNIDEIVVNLRKKKISQFFKRKYDPIDDAKYIELYHSDQKIPNHQNIFTSQQANAFISFSSCSYFHEDQDVKSEVFFQIISSKHKIIVVDTARIEVKTILQNVFHGIILIQLKGSLDQIQKHMKNRNQIAYQQKRYLEFRKISGVQRFIQLNPNFITNSSIQQDKASEINCIKFNLMCSNSTGIILVGGEGSRLNYEHKCMLKIGNKTLLERLIDKFIRSNFQQIIIADTRARVQNTKQFVCSLYPKEIFIFVSFQKSIGTGRTIIQCLKRVKTNYFFLTSGDIYHQIDLSLLYFDKSKYVGKILTEIDPKGKYYEDQGNTVKAINCLQDANILSLTTFHYSCIGCFSVRQFKRCQILKEEYGISQIFQILFSTYSIERTELGDKIFVNINTREDLKLAQQYFERKEALP